ncbi:hypothetical protein BC6307_21370 [Sutcliffiella cohnii]|uniref:Uncharacterized protein n=1 Tax=Sutcliffiella cohnii TaxID=33932 RepID=A0A223KVY8_9BACI|nr:hypothetical protein [Sutcliffiella cohnii]AST93631.1 hypothetical protein BC6307_21370 [Sutcliffiella cohnii]
MVIEFLGVPGAGKTYLTNSLIDYLKKEINSSRFILITRKDIENKKRVNYKSKCLKHISFFIILIRIMDINILTLLFKILSTKDSIFVKKRNLIYFIYTLLNYNIINQIKKENSDKNCVFILDEGLAHISSIFFSEKDGVGDIMSYFKRINSIKGIKYRDHKKLYIFVDGTVEKNFERMSKRKQGFPMSWKKLDEVEKTNLLKEYVLKYELKKNYITNIANEDNVVIDNTNFLTNYDSYFLKVKGLL